MHQTTVEPGLAAAIAMIPALAATPEAARRVERLGGLTNRVYRVVTPNHDLVVRVPGPGTETYIDRAVEAHNARAAAAADVSPALAFVAPEAGVLATAYMAGTTTMSGELFRSRPGAPARAGVVFRQLHDRAGTFEYRFELFAKIDEYLAYLETHPAPLPEGYHAVVAEAEGIRQQLAAHPGRLAPCHCDPLAENFLDDGQRMWLVDWEYSGMNDPLWDLGDLSVEAGFGPAQDDELLAAYFGRPPSPADRGRFVVYQAMCDLLWTLWGLIQHANGNPAEDFLAYAGGRFARCRKAMADPAFAGHVAAIAFTGS